MSMIEQPKTLLPQPLSGEVVPPERLTLSELTTAIKQHHVEVMKGLSHSCTHAIAAGEKLILSKDMLRKMYGHGNWQDHVTISLSMPMRTAQVYMLLARHKDKLLQLIAEKAQNTAFLSQQDALKFIRYMGGRRKRKLRPKLLAQSA